jgi:DNA polymerase I
LSGPLDHVQLKRVNTFEDAGEFMRWLGERRRVLGVDTETGGFVPERERLRLAQFGDLDTGWAIDWERWSGLVIEALLRYDGDMVLHNSKFDSRFLMHHAAGDLKKWPWERTHDTMTMSHILNPLRSKGLKPLSAMLIDPKAAAAQRMLDDAMTKNKWTWNTVPADFPLYWIYAAMDPVLTCHIYEKFHDEIESSYQGVYDLEMGTTRVIAKMETRGAKVDLPYCHSKSAEMAEWVDSARLWMRDGYGLDNPTDLTLLKYFQDNGIAMLPKLTKSGARQALDKEVLESIDHPIAKTILEIRKAVKQTGTYLNNLIKFADDNGYVHPSIWTMGTRTARMSITEPALQTLPRDDPTVRTAFIPSDGRVLITCDYDQIEARLTAHFSEDRGLIEAFIRSDAGEDFFCTIASSIFQREITKKDSERQLTKNTVYGKIYGAGVEKMAYTARVPVEVMQFVNTTFDNNFPGVRVMQNRINSQGRKFNPPMVETPTGRHMYADDRKEYTLTNYKIQCHASEILKRKLIELDAVFGDTTGVDMILPVHDEQVFDVERSIAQDVRREIELTMADRENYLVPITASSDLLEHNWGDKYRK